MISDYFKKNLKKDYRVLMFYFEFGEEAGDDCLYETDSLAVEQENRYHRGVKVFISPR
jgi:hypothetical protein